jgi:glyoxylase-like metal-dependent hydrolase (beta-lactamase superfamily II)
MEYERLEFEQPVYGGVNVLRVGDTLVDTGHVAPVSRDAVRAELDGGRLAGVERVLLTHPHIDHVGGSETIGRLADLPHVVPAGATPVVHGFGDYLRRARGEMSRLLAGFDLEPDHWDAYFPLGTYHEERIGIDRTLEDGDTVALGGQELSVLHTPGHAEHHVALWHEGSGTLFSGDLVSENDHFQYGPLYGDVRAYRNSLERVRDLEPARLVPMHGPEMADAGERIEASLSNVDRTADRLHTAAVDRGECWARDLARRVLGASEANAPFMTLITYEYLRYLEREGRLKFDVSEEGIRVFAD